jgi:CPA1 family monovalent cation:H+ antiporter
MLTLFELASALLVLCAALGFLNRSLLHLPNSVGLLLLGMLASLLLVAVELVFPDIPLYADIERALRQVDFTQLLFNGLLAFLLFAGALHVDFNVLRRRWRAVTYLSLVGTLASTVVTGLLFWLTCSWLGVPLSLPWAMVFGALISPTDPVGVLALLKDVPLPAEVKTDAEGEALFNDGVGVVLFTLFVGIAAGGGDLSWPDLAIDFVREAIGGAVLGLALGYLAYRAMRQIDDFPIEVLITLALVTGTYALAQRIGVSGPIATVAAGILIGHRAPQDAMSEQTASYVDALWTLIDEVLNAVLFLLIGIEVLVLGRLTHLFLVAVLAIPVVLVSRLAAVALPLLLPLRGTRTKATIPFLTWAAIRGGISIALALSLPPFDGKDVIVAATYAVVLFSVVVQGLSLSAVARWLGYDPTDHTS